MDKLDDILGELWEVESDYEAKEINFIQRRRLEKPIIERYNRLMRIHYKPEEIDEDDDCPCGLLHTINTLKDEERVR